MKDIINGAKNTFSFLEYLYRRDKKNNDRCKDGITRAYFIRLQLKLDTLACNSIKKVGKVSFILAYV